MKSKQFKAKNKTRITDIVIEKHPDNWYRDIPIMKYLILGSFPPHVDKWDYQFYYPNSQNSFWKILAEIASKEIKYMKDQPEKAVIERVEIMKKLKTGVQNLGREIQREGKSSLDEKIKITKFHDILGILKKHPECLKIILPGYSAPNSTSRSFIRYMKEQRSQGWNIEIPPKIKQSSGEQFWIKINNINYECFIVWSTSTANTHASPAQKLEQFKGILR